MSRSALALAVSCAVALCLAASPAGAGGLGALGFGGFQSGPLLGPGLDDDEPGNDTSAWADAGAGLEIIVGRRTARINGRARALYTATVATGDDAATAHSGVFTFGLSVQLQPRVDSAVGIYALLDLGVSGIALYHQERLIVDAGIGARFSLSGPAELFVEAAWVMQARDHVWHGARASGGLRLHFD